MNKKYEDIKNAVGYERLSDDDKDKRSFSAESESITSQKLQIEQFCKENNIKKLNVTIVQSLVTVQKTADYIFTI